MLKKIAFGAGLWLGLFIIISAVLVVPGASIIQAILKIVVFAAAGYGLAFYYFKKAPGDVKTGAILGLIWLAIIVVLDWLVIGIAALINQGDASLRLAYLGWPLYVSFLALIAGAAGAGYQAHSLRSLVKPATGANPFASDKNIPPVSGGRM